MGSGDTADTADCVCLCGNRIQLRVDAVLKEGVESCGCRPPNWKRHPRHKYGQADLTNQRFGRLVAIRPVGKLRSVLWEVKCDCGTVKSVSGANLITGNTKSCGCLQRERLAVQDQRRKERLAAPADKPAPEPEPEPES